MPVTPPVVDLWEAAPDEAPEALARAAQDRSRPPTCRCAVLSQADDALGLQVLGDDLPRGEASAVWVEGRGAFELLRVERWPPVPGGKRPRVLLKLRARR
jgi:hypothetical protein